MTNQPQPLAIYGAGGLGREIACLIRDINKQQQQWNLIGFYDDGKKAGSIIDHDLEVLGGLDDINQADHQTAIVVAIMDPQIKQKLIRGIKNPLIVFPVLIHPSCQLGNEQSHKFGRGVVIAAGNILTTHIEMGEFVFMNLASTVGHDVRIGDFTSVMPGCNISGNVQFGKLCNVGTGVRILQNLAIGNNSIIGAGAVVTKTFPANSKLIGVPALNVERHVD